MSLIMKSYFGESQVTLQGKAWQIRILLKRWQNEHQSGILLQDALAARTRGLHV